MAAHNQDPLLGSLGGLLLNAFAPSHVAVPSASPSSVDTTTPAAQPVKSASGATISPDHPAYKYYSAHPDDLTDYLRTRPRKEVLEIAQLMLSATQQQPSAQNVAALNMGDLARKSFQQEMLAAGNDPARQLQAANNYFRASQLIANTQAGAMNAIQNMSQGVTPPSVPAAPLAGGMPWPQRYDENGVPLPNGN
jgi:hypothetical protein